MCEHQDLRLENFQKIKNFILQNGDRKTYCNRWNNNPHYGFPDFEAFLDPGPIDPVNDLRWSLSCDPSLTEFDTLVILTKDHVYFDFRYDRRLDGVQVGISNGIEGDHQDRALSLFREILDHVTSGVHEVSRKATP